MRYYTFTQNNSGGHFDFDNDLSLFVIIEADNSYEANKKAESLGMYFDGCDKGIDCGCCGDRWYSVDDRDYNEKPLIYNDEINKHNPYKTSNDGTFCIVHYKDGTKKYYTKKGD